jgi:enamine deaminase RidA (YjgF/YER057c/UK114 family)
MRLKHLNPPELPDWSALFSQVVVAEESPLRIVAISGQVGVDVRQAVASNGSFEAQTKKAFENLAVALSAARCSVADVMKRTIYVVGYEPEKAGVITEVLRHQFGDRDLPALTLVGVQTLAKPEFQIEIEALAIATP